MPRFYFDICDGRLPPDNEGFEFPSVKSAIAEAVRAARELATESRQGDRGPGHRIEVRNQAGGLVGVIPFEKANAIADPTLDLAGSEPRLS